MYRVDILNDNYFKTYKTKYEECVFLDLYEKFILKVSNSNNNKCNVKINFNNKSFTIRLEPWKSHEMKNNIFGDPFIFEKNTEIVVEFLPEKPGLDLSYKKVDGYATPIQVDYSKSEKITLKLINKTAFKPIKIN